MLKKELPYFSVDDACGSSQAWFSTWMMREGGCGAVTACDCCIYYSLEHVKTGPGLAGDGMCMICRNLVKPLACAPFRELDSNAGRMGAFTKAAKNFIRIFFEENRDFTKRGIPVLTGIPFFRIILRVAVAASGPVV